MSGTTRQMAGTAPREQNPDNSQHVVDAQIIHAIRHQVSQDGDWPCGHYLCDVIFRCCNGVVTVEGRVPTLRLKKAILSRIEMLRGVAEIDDRLDVVSSTGLSSVRPK